jgi:hypothetical protein
MNADEEDPVDVGEDEDGVDKKESAIVEQVELANDVTDSGVRALLVDQDHESGLQVGEEEAEEERRHDEQHESLLVAEGVDECNDA